MQGGGETLARSPSLLGGSGDLGGCFKGSFKGSERVSIGKLGFRGFGGSFTGK